MILGMDSQTSSCEWRKIRQHCQVAAPFTCHSHVVISGLSNCANVMHRSQDMTAYSLACHAAPWHPDFWHLLGCGQLLGISATCSDTMLPWALI